MSTNGLTAGATLSAMIPVAFGMGTGGEQTAPFGRAATFATLFFVPVVYSYLRKNAPVEIELDDEGEKES